MKRLFCLALLLILFALPFTLPTFAGHAVVGSGQTINCDCSTQFYVCLDDETDEPLPPCNTFAASARRGHRVK